MARKVNMFALSFSHLALSLHNQKNCDMNLFNDFLNTISDTEVTTTSAIFKLMLSLLLGGIVGFERKRKGQVAGARTFALISMGATLAMIISIYIPQVYLGLKNGDPGRVAAQVITGVGFLAGTP